MTKKEAIAKFRRAFLRKFGKRAFYEHSERAIEDDGYKMPERIDVSVSLDIMEWGEIEPAVEAMIKRTGLGRYFETGGAGTGFGFRDVSIYRRGQ
jgi:hypothetical protein